MQMVKAMFLLPVILLGTQSQQQVQPRNVTKSVPSEGSIPGSRSTKAPGLDFFDAALIGDVEAIGRFLKMGVDLNALDPRNEMPALLEAAEKHHLPVIRELISAGADPKLRDGSGRTAMHVLPGGFKFQVQQASVD